MRPHHCAFLVISVVIRRTSTFLRRPGFFPLAVPRALAQLFAVSFHHTLCRLLRPIRLTTLKSMTGFSGAFAQRAREWQSLRGLRRVIARIKIEIWAWRETAREQRRIHQDDSAHKL
jgi:hypothetical protein